MFINADKANPTIGLVSGELQRRNDPNRIYRAPLVVHAKHKKALKAFFHSDRHSKCDGEGVGVKVFYGRYYQQKGKSAEGSVSGGSDWLRDVMLAKFGIPGVTEALQEVISQRKKFVLISARTHVNVPKLFRHQLSIVCLHATTHPVTRISFSEVADLLERKLPSNSRGYERAVDAGVAPAKTGDPDAAWEYAFDLSKVEI